MTALRLVRAAEPLTSISLNDEIECEVFEGRRWRVIFDGRRMLSLRCGNWLIQRAETELMEGNEGWRRV